MSSSELRIEYHVESLVPKALSGLKYNLTKSCSWLVKRVFVNIIKTRSDSNLRLKGFEVMGNVKKIGMVPVFQYNLDLGFKVIYSGGHKIA